MSIVVFFALASNALAVNAVFPDVSDETLARKVGILQMLGVIGGDGNGNFVPDGTLTRAAFCKMAVITMGQGDKVALYKNVTKFPDVKPSHWACGYINLAVSGEKKIVLGTSNGLFQPDKDITYAQAITMTMRMLGYTDADAGMLWPEGYLALAADTGLTDGLEMVSPGASITRAQAAHLFCNLLGTPIKGGASYISTLGTATEGVVIMQLDVRAADGTNGAIRTSAGIYKTVSGVVPPSILGLRGMLLENPTTGKVLTFLPDENKQQDIVVQAADAGWLKDSSNTTYTVPATTAAYTATEVTTYDKAFLDIAAGMHVTLFYSSDGKVDGIYINTSKTDSAVVIGSAGSVGALTNGYTGYSIIKNGAPATSSDLKPYDVATYDASARILYVSDFRLTGYYEKSWPNMTSPSKITLMGCDLPVLPSAISSLSNYKVGQFITLLLTADLQVAGAVTSGVTGSTAIGVVQPGITTSSAAVKLLNGLVVKGNPAVTDNAASQLAGELVSVSSAGAGWITLNVLGNSGISSNLDLVKKTLGSAALSPAVKVFERVGSGSAVQISLKDIAQAVISNTKVIYAGKDSAGYVDMLVLNDVTGDRYSYGLLDWESGNNSVSVINKENQSGTEPVYIAGNTYANASFGGIAFTPDGSSAAGFVVLTAVTNVERSAFYTRDSVTYLTVNGVEFPVASNVECFNSLSRTWFETLYDARAFSTTLTVYYDRAASEGGKIRMVVAG